MNSSCFMICELNWIVFMAIVKRKAVSYFESVLGQYTYSQCRPVSPEKTFSAS